MAASGSDAPAAVNRQDETDGAGTPLLKLKQASSTASAVSDAVIGKAVESTLSTAEKTIENLGKISGPLKRKMEEKMNWLTQTTWFKNTCNDVFTTVDVDNTKLVDMKELYAAVLLVYVYISRLVPGGAYPPTAKDVTELMHAVCPGKEEVGPEEFQSICIVLMHNISQRLIFQVILAFIVCPFLGSMIVTIYCLIFTPSAIWAIIPDGFMPSVFASLLLMFVLPKTLEYIDQRTVREHTEKRKLGKQE